MRAKAEYRNRPPTQVAVLDVLVNRTDGMTIFEIRAEVEVDIDDLEQALSALKTDSLIDVESRGSRTVITPADRVVPDEPEPNTDESLSDWLRKRMPF